MTVKRSSFIEVQFPISKLSKESYKERKAGNAQTLPGMGKWWGRKPLILVRAILFGLLLSATENPKRDREIFLKLMMMDEEGLWLRKMRPIPLKVISSYLSDDERFAWFDQSNSMSPPQLRRGLTSEERERLQHIVFSRLSYDNKLEYCDCPHQSLQEANLCWAEINSHLGTDAHTLPQLIEQLSIQQFGHIPRVGDAFCGGGSIPFEAARIGCEVYASDLNPVAALLTWASLHLVGGDTNIRQQLHRVLVEAYEAANEQITAWGIEQNEQGWRADAYLYCAEVKCPECGWSVPLAPSWIIGEKTRTIAKLHPNQMRQGFDITIISGVSVTERETARTAGTMKNSTLICPNPACLQSTPITMIRGDRRTTEKITYGLRMWEKNDFLPRQEDTFQEKLYCIRWVETFKDSNGRTHQIRHYHGPDEQDCMREARIVELLSERFDGWQEKGYIPSRSIMMGEKTNEPIRTRGWTYWHHLFNPRQLLTIGCFFSQLANVDAMNSLAISSLLLNGGRYCDYNAKLSRWDSTTEKIQQVFSNQALNTLFNYGARTLHSLRTAFLPEISSFPIEMHQDVYLMDARAVRAECDIWLTDPSYGDSVNYHELSEFFLAWYEKHLQKVFPSWYTDSKRSLAINNSMDDFLQNMVQCYRNLASCMPDNGRHVVMFTHQDARIWADLALILWASSLRVVASWCIATETDSALREGNYVKGTVLLVLRKQLSNETVFLDEIYSKIEYEVKSQLDAMTALDDMDAPNFGDTDYQLAAYAATLRLLTQYKCIEEIDISYELSKRRKKGEESPVERVIADAMQIASTYLVPKGFDTSIWKLLSPQERFYLKGLDLEMHNEHRISAYQELARAFGVREYSTLLANEKANQMRLKTATELRTRFLGNSDFGNSLVRQVLFAIWEVTHTSEVQSGKQWLRTEVRDYWNRRKVLISLLSYIANLGRTLPHWQMDSKAALLLSGALGNDHI